QAESRLGCCIQLLWTPARRARPHSPMGRSDRNVVELGGGRAQRHASGPGARGVGLGPEREAALATRSSAVGRNEFFSGYSPQPTAHSLFNCVSDPCPSPQAPSPVAAMSILFVLIPLTLVLVVF